MSTKHRATKARYETASETIRSVPENYWLANMNSWDGAVDHAYHANLFAAAPDMLAALKAAFQHHPSAFVLSCGLPLTAELEAKPEIMALRAVLAAIAKAEGRS